MNIESITEQQIQALVKIANSHMAKLDEIISSISDTSIVTSVCQWKDSFNETFRNIQSRSESLLKDHEKLGALAGIGRVVNSSLELPSVLQIVMDTIIRLINAERGFLMLYDEKGILQLRIARNWEQETLNEQEITLSRTLIHEVESTGVPVLTTNALKDPRFENQDSVIAFNLRSIICVPLKVKGLLIGIIYTDNRIKAGLFTNRELNLLTSFADQAAVALENAKLYESIQKSLKETTELKQLLDNVFTSVTSGILTMDVNLKLLYCNKPLEIILGISINEIIGEQFEQVFPFFVGKVKDAIQKVIQNGESIKDLEGTVRLISKTESYLSVTISALRSANGDIIGSVLVIDDLTERKRLESKQRLFERMVAPEIIKQLDPDKLLLGGNKREISVLFADIRAFTRFSENVGPEELIVVLNKYFSLAGNILLDHGGTIDKFMGDCILAWFNAPLEQPDHVIRAVRSALAIQKSIKEIKLSEHNLQMGIGIHTGEAVLGLVGTEMRMEYTAIGDTVNIARRLQELAVAGQILISSSVKEIIKNNYYCELRGSELLKGKTMAVEVFEVIREK